MEKMIQANEDESYVIKAQQGDQEALVYLLKKYHNLAHYIALKLCHCDADAEDIVQESFIEIQKSIKNLREPKYFKAWLNKIIFSKSTQLFRKNKDVNMSDQESIKMANIIEDRRFHQPDKEMRYQGDKQILLNMIDELPEKLKITLYMMYFEQMSVKEISIALDIPDGTVKSRVSSAKKELQTKIKAYEEKEHIKLNFYQTTLEVMLLEVLASEYTKVIGHVKISPFTNLKVSKLIRVIHPTTFAMVAACTICSATAYIVYQNSKESDFQLPVVTSYVNEDIHTFEPLSFQGVTLYNAKEAHEALIYTAHCHVEIDKLDEKTQNEIRKLYHALKKNGGVYYELLQNRGYNDNFE